MNWQRTLLGVGVIALSVGLLGVIAPGSLALGFGRPVASLVGLAALVQAFRVARDRYRSDHTLATTIDPEARATVPAPGDDLPEALDRIVAKRDGMTTRMQEELRSTALEVLTWYGGHADDEAALQLRNGTWTEDEYAAAFLDDENSLPGRGLRSVLSGESRYQRSVRRTIDEIATIAGLPRHAENGADGPLAGLRRRIAGEDSQASEDTGTTRSSPAISDDLAVRRETGYWQGISVVALAGIGVGVLAERPAVMLIGVVGICYGAYARMQTLSEISLAVDRELADTDPATGESVEVSVSVTNEGEGTLPDVRLVDGVPGGLSVESGRPRAGALLRPGETVEFSYTVEARRGAHEFGPVQAIVRNVPGTIEHERAVTAETRTTMTCIPPLHSLPVTVPLPEGSTRYAGTEETSAGGEGTEFHATREYRASDPMNRIDWNRQAKTGELATLVFREERTATVVLVIDNDLSAYLSPNGRGEHALDRSVGGAGQVFTTLLDARHRVGIATLGDADCWLPPRMGSTQRTRGRRLLGTHGALDSVPREPEGNRIRLKRTLYRRLPADAHLMLFSPLCDQFVVKTARQFEAAGYPVTVVSPDPTVAREPGQLLARIRRRLRISDLRHSGVPVVDWDWDEPLAAAISRFSQRGSEIR